MRKSLLVFSIVGMLSSGTRLSFLSLVDNTFIERGIVKQKNCGAVEVVMEKSNNFQVEKGEFTPNTELFFLTVGGDSYVIYERGENDK